MLRACGQGFKIGPLFADDEDAAEPLFLALASHAPNVPLFLDTPKANPTAIALARRNGMSPSFETVRMYNHPLVDEPGHRTFGVTTFELG